MGCQREFGRLLRRGGRDACGSVAGVFAQGAAAAIGLWAEATSRVGIFATSTDRSAIFGVTKSSAPSSVPEPPLPAGLRARAGGFGVQGIPDTNLGGIPSRPATPRPRQSTNSAGPFGFSANSIGFQGTTQTNVGVLGYSPGFIGIQAQSDTGTGPAGQVPRPGRASPTGRWGSTGNLTVNGTLNGHAASATTSAASTSAASTLPARRRR